MIHGDIKPYLNVTSKALLLDLMELGFDEDLALQVLIENLTEDELLEPIDKEPLEDL